MSAIRSGGRGVLSKGMRGDNCPRSRCTRGLSWPLPGTITWPERPPFRARARASSLSPLRSRVDPWQRTQLSSKMGAMSRTKSGGGEVVRAAAAERFAVGSPEAGHAAPSSIQRFTSAIRSDDHGSKFGGMRTPPPVPRRRFTSRLPWPSPGTNAGPETPPRRAISRLSSRSPPRPTTALWHMTHCPWSRGSTSRAKSTARDPSCAFETDETTRTPRTRDAARRPVGNTLGAAS